MTRFELVYSFLGVCIMKKIFEFERRKQAIPSAMRSTEQEYALLDFLLV